MSENPDKLCRELCRETLMDMLRAEMGRIDAILKEREKATELLARNEIAKQASEIMKDYVLTTNHDKQISILQDQLTGPLGLELRMRIVEQAKGAVDAKLYMIIIGVPIVVTAIVNVFISHILK